MPWSPMSASRNLKCNSEKDNMDSRCVPVYLNMKKSCMVLS